MIIVSDLHFGKNKKRDISKFVDIAKNPRYNPEKLVVIPGDFNTSKYLDDKEFYLTTKFIKELIKNKLRVVVTLGNHDIERFNEKAKKHFTNLFEEEIYTQDNMEIVAKKGFDSITRVDDEIFLSLLSIHKEKPRRIRGKQVQWAASQLEGLKEKGKLEGKKLHLLTHVSLWHGSHKPMEELERLERELFEKFNFYSVIHGHNHDFICAKRTTPVKGITIIQLSAPTLSTRTNVSGFVVWKDRTQFAEFLPIDNEIEDDDFNEIIDEEEKEMKNFKSNDEYDLDD